jgi:hypothetical protein
MNVVCGVNGEPWKEDNPLFVCHHCGMPVCQADGLTVGADDAFDASDRPVHRAAMHCPQCASENHPRARTYSGWIDPKAQQAVARTAAAQTAAIERNRARAIGRS